MVKQIPSQVFGRKMGSKLLGAALLLSPFSMSFAAPNLSATSNFTAADGVRSYMDVGGVWNGTSDIAAAGSGGDVFRFEITNSAALDGTPLDDTAFEIAPSVSVPANFQLVGSPQAIVVNVAPTGAGSCTAPTTITATQASVGANVTFSFSPAGYDLEPECRLTLDYGLTTTASETAGTKTLTPQWSYDDTDGAGGTVTNGQISQTVQVQAGDFFVSKAHVPAAAVPAGQSGKIGTTEAFDIEVSSSGAGGIFAVQVDDTLGAGFNGSLTFDDSGLPAGVTGSVTGANQYTLNYIPPNTTATIRVTSTIAGCTAIDNRVDVRDKLFGTSAKTEFSLDSITLNLENPDVFYNVPTINFDYTGGTPVATVNATVTNNGPGVTDTIRLRYVDFPNGTVAVTSGPWVHNAGASRFEYTGGVLASGASANFTFTVTGSSCPFNPGSTEVTWEIEYENGCDDVFTAVPKLSDVTESNEPSLNLGKSVSSRFLSTGDTATYTVSLSGVNSANFASTAGVDNDLQVVDQLPASGIGSISIAAPNIPAGVQVLVGASVATASAYTPGSPITPGHFVVINADVSDLPLSDMIIDFTATNSTTSCNSGFPITNTASATVTSCPGFNPSASAEFVPNEIVAGDFSLSEDFVIANAGSAPFETGLADSNGVREAGEGEHINYRATYGLTDTRTSPSSTWTGSKFVAELGTGETPALTTQTPVTVGANDYTGFVQFQFADNGGALSAIADVPNASISINGSGELEVDLSFLGAGNVNDDQLIIYYTTTVADADIASSSDGSPGGYAQRGGQFLERATLQVVGGPNGCSGAAEYTSAIDVGIVRADPEISTSFTTAAGNGFVDVCEIVPVTINISSPGPAGNPTFDLYSDNTRAELDLGDSWRFVNAAGAAGNTATDITYAGHFNSNGQAVASVVGSGVGSLLRLDADPQNRPYEGSDGDSTALVNLQLQPGYSNENLISRILFDDNQTRFDLSASRDFTKTTTNTRPKVRQAALTVTNSPDQVFLDDRTIRWTFYVQNTGTGIAYNATVKDVLPDLYTPVVNTAVGSGGDTTFNLDNTGNETAVAPCYTNTGGAFSACGSVTNQNTLVWELGDIQPGATRTIQVTATVDSMSGACAINQNTNADGTATGNEISAQWGCGTTFVSSAKVGPTYSQSTVNLQVLQDSSSAFCTLCDQGDLNLRVRNSGSGKLFNVNAIQDLGAAGIRYVPGTAMVSINGAAAVAAGDPTESATLGGAAVPAGTGRFLTWDSTDIPALAELDNVNGSGPNDILITFRIQSPGEALASATDADKTVQASASYEPACGAAAAGTSTGTAFVLETHLPNVSIDKVGWNNSVPGANEGLASDTVYGGNADQVVWRVTVSNASGSTVVDAEDILVRDFLSTANMNIDDYCVVSGAQNFTNCGGFVSFTSADNDVNTETDVAAQLSLADSEINPGETQRFYFRGTVQSLCDNPVNTAQIEWGCPGDGGAGGIVAASPLNDTARLVTSPDSSFGQLVIQNHTVTWSGGGRGLISFRLRNNGGTARNISIDDVVPVGFTRDASFAPTITHSAGILDTLDASGTTTATLNVRQSGVAFGAGTAQQNILRNSETLDISFGIVLNASFDTTTGPDDREETVGDGFDPADVGTNLSNQITVDFENTCAINQTDVTDTVNNINPELPDLDINLNPSDGNLNYVVTGAGDTQNYTVRVTNNGDGQAFADGAGVAEIQVDINVGLAWTSPAIGDFSFSGGSGSCVAGAVQPDFQPYTCTITSPINAGGNVDISFTPAVNGATLTSEPLSIEATVTANLLDSAGVDTGNDYSLDAIRARTLGFNVSKDIQSCSENEDGLAFPLNNVRPSVQIGEDCTFRIVANWFGAPGETISAISLRDDIEPNVGYVSHNLLGSSELTLNNALRDNDTNPLDDGTPLVYGDQANVSGSNGRDFYFHFADYALTATGDDITLDVVTRILNQSQNIVVGTDTEDRHNFSRQNVATLQFTAFGQTFNAATTGYPDQNTIRRERVRSRTPNPTITKQIRNVTQDMPAGAGNYADNVVGQAGDVLEYRIQVSNADLLQPRMPLFDAVVTDALDSNLTIQDFSTDTIDNDGDGLIDGADAGGEGLVAGQNVSFDSTHNSTANGAGRGLQKMVEDDVVTLLVRATINNTAVTGSSLTNTATMVGDTLLGDRGNAFDGGPADDATGDIMGARRYTVSSNPPARVTISPVITPAGGSKRITNLSLNSDGAAFPISPTAGSPLDVVVGEEVQYELIFIVPSSTVNDLVLVDNLPAGLSCVEAQDITLPSGFAPGGTFSPTCTGSQVRWDFSNSGAISHVVSGAEAGRTVTGSFIARVDNNAGNVQAATVPVTNVDAEVTYSGGQMVDLDDAHLRVVEPSVSLTKAIAPAGPVDAGDVLTVTVTAQNTSTDTAAYNVRIQDDLVTPEKDVSYNVGSDSYTANAGCTFGTADTTTTDVPLFNITSIAANTTCTFTFNVTVETAAQPAEVLDDTLQGAWTSLPSNTTALINAGAGPIGTDGAANGMRNGAIPNVANALNDYEATASAQVLMATPTIAKADQNPALVSTIGALKQYQVTLNLPEGTHNGVQVTDNLAAGAASFVLENDATNDVTYTLNNIASINGVSALGSTADIEAAMTAVPADEATGSILWNIGAVVTNVENDNATTAISPSITITYFARINNDANTDAGDALQNSAQLTFNNGETGATNTVNAPAVPAITVVEPALSNAQKQVRNVTKGNAADFSDTVSAPDAGDILEYRISLQASNAANTSDVFDIALVDTLPAGVSYVNNSSAFSAVAGFVSSNVGVASDNSIQNPDISGSMLTWSTAVAAPSDIDIQRGETVYILYRVLVADSVLGNQTLQNSIVPAWSSLDGSSADERTGAGGVNDYTLAPLTSTAITSDNNDLAKAVVSDTFAAGNVRVGDVITYRLTLTLQEGTSDTLVIRDELDAGLEFIDTLSIGADTASPFAAAAPFTYADLTAGTQITTTGAVASGQTINWNFGNLVNAGNNSSAPAVDTDTLVIEYRVRVADEGLVQAASTVLNNNAGMLYNLATGAAPVEEASAAVTADMPILATSKTANPATTSTVTAGQTITYTVTVANSGNAPAYDVVVRDTLSAGLRAGGVPVLADITSITVNGAAATSFAPSAVGTFASDGQIQWDFDNGSADNSEYTINPGQSMVIVYSVDVDGDVPSGATLTNSANVQNYYSFNDDTIPAGSVVTDRQDFGTSTAAGTTHSTPTPNNLAKVADKTSATIGEVVTYTITVPDTAFGAQLFDVAVTDSLPADVSFVSAAFGAGNGATGALGNSVNGANVLTLNGFDIPANQRAVIDVQVRVNNTAGESGGDTFQNSASYVYQRSDGGSDNVSGGAAIQAPAVTITEPLLNITKQGRNISTGGALGSAITGNAGDQIEYQISLSASAGANFSDAFDAEVTDVLPADVTFDNTFTVTVTGAGNLVNDPVITLNAAGDTLVWSDSGTAATANDINVTAGSTVVLTYRVTLDNDVQPGQQLPNNASVSWDSLEDSGNDRGSTGGVNDYNATVATPVTLTVPNATAIAKSDANDDAAVNDADPNSEYRVGELVTYTVAITNLPEATFDNFEVQDTLPAGLTFITGSSSFTPGGNLSATNLAPTPNVAGSPQVITWDFGTLVNAGESSDATTADTLSISYTVLISDAVAAGDLTGQTNTALVRYDVLSGIAGSATTTHSVSDNNAIDIPQPLFNPANLTKSITNTSVGGDTSAEVVPNEVVTFQLSACNVGGAPAYDVVVQDVLPAEMRDTAPTINTVTIGGVVAPSGTDYTNVGVNPVYTAATGTVVWTFGALADAVQPSDCIVINYSATVDADVGPNQTFNNAFRVDDYFSRDNTEVGVPANSIRRDYAATADTTLNLNTPNEVPTQLTKTTAATTATIGEEVTYTLTIPGTGTVSSSLRDIEITDTLSTEVEFVSAAFNAGNVGGSGTIASNVVANTLTLTGVDIAASNTAVIDVTVRVRNTIDQNSGDTFTNTASYTYELVDGGSADNVPTGAAPVTPAITIVEPLLSSVKAVRNITRGDGAFPVAVPTAPDAGDVLEYQVTISHAPGSNAAAFDINAVDTLGAGLSLDNSFTPTATVGGVAVAGFVASPAVAGQNLTWGRSNADENLDLPLASSLVLTYRVVVQNNVEPEQALGNSIVADWTSLNGVDANERNNGAAPNDYVAAAATSSITSRNDSALTKARSSDTFNAADDNVRVGDVVTFTLTATFQEGTTDGVLITDTLPVGLAYLDTVSINGDTAAPYAGTAPFSYTVANTVVNADTPAAGQTRLDWNFATVINEGIADANNAGNNTVAIVYRAKVLSTAGNSLQNDADFNYELASGAAGTERTDNATLAVQKPILATTKTANPATTSTVTAGQTITYTVTVANSGNAPAYDVVVRDTLSAGLRGGGVPVLADITSITVNGAAATNFAPSAVGTFATDGQIQWDFDNGSADNSEYTINPGQSMVIVYSVDVDGDVPPGATLTNSANVQNYYSFNDDTIPAGSVVTDRQDFGASAAAGTTHSTPTPGNLSKTASTTTATIGEIVTYQLTVPAATFGAQLYDVVVTDTLPSNVSFVSAAYGAGNGAGVTDVLTTSVGAGNVLTISTAAGGFDVPANQSAVIDVEVRVNNTATENIAGTFQNSASYTYETSNGGAANLSGGAAVQAPAVTIEEPGISAFNKAGRNITKGDPATFATFSAPDPGDILEYQLSFTADGAANRSDVFDLIIVDTLPAGTTYQAGSSAFAAGSSTVGVAAGNTISNPSAVAQVHTWNLAAGSDIDIQAGETVIVTYRVQVANTATAGQVLTNSATVEWSSLDGASGDERTGAGGVNDYSLPAQTSTTTVRDNTAFAKTINADSFGTGPGASDGTVRIGDTIDFALTASLNNGTTNSVVITDTLPAGMEFVSTVSVNGDTTAPYNGSAPFTFSTNTVPSVGQTNLTWNLGTVVNDGTANATATDDLVIIYRVRIADGVLAAAASTNLQNNAALNYNTATGAAAPQTSNQTATVQQPILAMTKSTTATSPVTAGQNITYILRVENSGAAPAYDVRLQDVVPVGMRAGGVAGVTVNSVTINGGASVGTPAPAANANFANDGLLNWDLNTGTTFTIPAATGTPGALELSYTITIDSNVGTGISLQNTARVTDYFSFDDDAIPSGSTLPDRESFGATATSSTTLTTPTPSVMSKTANPTAVAVGELVTYTLTVPDTAVNAALFDVDIRDQLPSGVVCATANCNVRFGPGNAATGALDASLNASNLLTITNVAGGLDIPANGQAIVLVDVVVSDTVAVADRVGSVGSTFSNSATYTYENTNGGSSNLSGGAAAVATVTVEEPELTLTKEGPATIDLGGTPVTFTVWADNTGNSAAFNAVIQDRLPALMRDNAPSSITVARFTAIGGTQVAALTAGADYTTSYTAASGDLLISLQDTAVIADTEVLRIQYNAQLNNVSGADLANLSVSDLTNEATATQWRSTPSTNANGRVYNNAFGTGTGADGDDATAEHTVAVNAPILSVVKSVQNATNALSTPNADPGDTLTYSVVISNSGDLAATVDFTDDIEALNPLSVFVPGTLSNITVTPAATPSAPTANNSNTTGGVQGTGIVAFTGIEIPARSGGVNGTRTISFDITLRNPLPNGSFAYNQASITAPFLTAPILSDSNLAADDNAAETGNDNGNPNDDDPVVTRIPAMPGLIVEKRDTDLNGGNLELGDVLRYTITVRNIGNENADNSFLTDTVPGNTTYVANSTTLNGNAIADVGGTSPLASGISINSADTAVVGRVSGNQLGTATIEFDVRINTGLVPGTLISNQAIVTAQGAGGPISTSFSDDPDTNVRGDPTQNVVGNAPFIDVQKTVGSPDSPLVAGSVLNYTFIISNLGNQAATGVVLSDTLPAEITYVANTTQLNGVAVNDGTAGEAPFTLAAGMPVNSDGTVLAAGQEATVTFQATVNAGLAAGTVIRNQGTVSSNELPDELSDLDGNDENGDQPTEIVFGSGPAIRISKQLQDLNGGTVEAGDVLEYIVQVRNIGTADATSVSITDDISALPISYETNSSTIKGAAMTDAVDGDAFNFNTGTSVLTAAIGTLIPRDFSTLRFRATVDSVAPATVIDNQAVATDASGANVNDNAAVMIGGTPGSANLSGQVWLDLDHDDVFDVGVETPQQGWIVRILNGTNIVAEAVTDAAGNYQFNGLPPGSGYEVQFLFENSPASVGNTVSAQFTPIGQTIRNITLSAGDNVLDQNLPIDPSGVVYDSVRRVPVAGVTLNMFYTLPGGTRLLLDASCLNPGQAGQVTGTNGFYAFDVNTAPPCPGSAATYEIEVSSVPELFINGISTSIPPQAGALEADLCRNGAGGDSLPLTVDCEVSPLNTHPTGDQATTFFIQFNLDTNGLGTNVFNNHIPIDPILEGALVLRKSTPKVNVTRGELVPYTITASISQNLAVNELNGLEIRDTLPPGFKYVEGSARVNGVNQAPASQSGRNFVWNNITVRNGEELQLTMVLIVGAGVTENRYINTAQAFNSAASIAVSNSATATVRVVPDPTFDCTDIIGKVYDDKDANGYQDKGEEALPAVRVATARGWLVTTDDNGRYHITCAAVPNEERGSNFIIKLDERSLPSGYRVTTENPRVVRLTRGKVAKANFGATIHRVVRLDLMNAAFVDGSDDQLQEEWLDGLDPLIDQLKVKPSILRLVYLADEESKAQAETRLENIKELLESRWKDINCCYNLSIETNVYWRGIKSGNKVNNKKLNHGGVE